MFKYTFDWSVLWRHPFGSWMLQGTLVTIHLSLLAWTVALPLGITIGTLRTLPSKWIRAVGTVYVEVFRNIPLLVQLFFWYFAAPEFLPDSVRQLIYQNLAPCTLSYCCTAIGLSLFTASRVAEHVRSGLSSISKSQYLAAFSTGLTSFQVYRFVIIPYAIRILIPPITTEFLTCFKNSALGMVLGVMEITYITQRIDSYTFHGLEALTGAMLVYLFINLSIAGLMGFVERFLSIPGLIQKTE